MKRNTYRHDSGSVIIATLSTILILSIIGAGVLINCATRYNTASKQVKAYKEALYAAEAGGDIGFAEVRKICTNPGAAFSATGTSPAPGWLPSASFSPVPTPSPASATSTAVAYQSGPYYFGQSNSLQCTVTVDKFFTDSTAPTNVQDFYRIRSVGTAKVFGLPRVTMDDRMDLTTRGDNWLRKIDYAYDRFKATYGDGDKNSVGGAVTVSQPQMTRRIELICVPITAFSGALKASGSFNGPGSAGVVDSYDSKNGAYTFVADKPASPLYQYSHLGNVEVGTSSFTEGGPIYGNVTTNGGTVSHSGGTNISGTIDNNVPFTVPPLPAPSTVGFSSLSSGSNTITPASAGSAASPNRYVITGDSNGLTINAAGGVNTYVTVVVNGNISNKVQVGANVTAKIYFAGDMNIKASNIVNNNVDGTSPYISRAGQLQFYGISPGDGSYQSINISPPGNVYAVIYAPNANLTLGGNPDWYGGIVVHDFSGNGNTGFHYDAQLALIKGIATDYQLASYIEDVR
jgi:hypothetical protein